MGRVIVIGGGPGGSTAATMLARSGHEVVVLERERFPRDHVGESLLPASVPILEALGVREAVEAGGALKKWGATMVWGRDRAPWSWYFRETNTAYPHAYQVARPQFDQLLLENSVANGAELREGVRVTEAVFDASGRATGVRFARADGSTGTETADFVVDASGQAAVLGRALGLRRYDEDFRNMAVYAWFEGGRRLDPPDETNILVESYVDGWMWVIPLPNGITSAGAVVDHHSTGARVRGDELTSFLTGEIAKTSVAKDLLAGASMTRAPFSLRDWSYVSDRVVGDGFILVGDAACFVDPLFSSGVHLALSAGVLAAAFVNSALVDPAMATAAGPAYEELYLSQYRRFHELAKLFYASNRTVDSYFWEARRILGRDAGGADESARLDFIRAVAGQPPQGYERAVLTEGELPPGFGRAVDEAEADLRGRRAEVDALGDRLSFAIPVLAPRTRVERKPVLEGDRFAWGDVLVSAERAEGVPVSRLVAQLVQSIDGRRTVGDLCDHLLAGLAGDDPRRPDVIDSLRFVVGTLYVDRAIATLVVGPG